jgi:hypothetical protein
MHRVLIVVEGFTERAIVEQTFAPYLGDRGLAVHAKVVGKPGHKGGVRNFDNVRKEILALLRQERGSHVSTFFDFYGLPEKWPGRIQAKGKPARELARLVEAGMREEVTSKLDDSEDATRFVPYVQMHEVEALLFADTNEMASVFEQPNLEPALAEIVGECGECEEINDHRETAPSKRIERLFPGYRKGSGARAHAPLIVRRIGVDRLRTACPHFHDWMKILEGFASAET